MRAEKACSTLKIYLLRPYCYRSQLQRVVMVGDRGVLTSARIEQTLRPAGLDWITALRAPAIKQLAAEGGPLQPSLFDDRDMPTGQARGLKAHEITSPDYPGERLVVCKNPLLTEERRPTGPGACVGLENDGDPDMSKRTRDGIPPL